MCYRWTRSHGQVEVDGESHRAERVAAGRDGERRGALLIRCIDGRGRSTTAGQGWGAHDGQLLVGGVVYSLNRPALAARLIQAALTAGWRPGGDRDVEFDGIALLAATDAPSEPQR